MPIRWSLTACFAYAASGHAAAATEKCDEISSLHVRLP